MASSYFELLKHPNWQRKRLEVLERENYTCQECGNTEKTLHVHHTYYTKGAKPWEYPSESLKCLCETCHEEATGLLEALKVEIGRLGNFGLSSLLGYVRVKVAVECGIPTAIIEDEAQDHGVCDYFHGLSREDIEYHRNADGNTISVDLLGQVANAAIRHRLENIEAALFGAVHDAIFSAYPQRPKHQGSKEVNEAVTVT